MSEVSFPSNFDELLNSPGFSIMSPELITNMESEEIAQYIQELIEIGNDLSNEEAADKVITFLYCSVDMMSNFTVDNQSMFVQYVIDLAKASVDQLSDAGTTAEKNTYKKILYLFQHICFKLENNYKSSGGIGAAPAPSKAKTGKKKSADEGFCWPDLRVYALDALEQLVVSKLSVSWPMGLVQDSFLSNVWSYTLKLLIERPAGIGGTAHKDIAARTTCVRIFARTVSHFGSAKSSASYATVSTALLEAIVQHEHFAGSVGAELCSHCRHTAPAQGSQVVAEVLSDICRMNFAIMPATSIKNIGSFVEAFAKAVPACVAETFPILVKQLDSPAHQIRSAVIHACGYIVTYIHDTVTAQQEHQQQQQTGTSSDPVAAATDSSEAADGGRNVLGLVRSRDVILDILTERAHDVNPYTRAVVLKVWVRLLESGSVPVKRVGGVAQVAVDRLSDKNAAVRRNAVVLMTTAIENNPFSGTLDAALFRLQQSELEKALTARMEELRVAYRDSTGTGTGVGSSSTSSTTSSKKTAKELRKISEQDEEEEVVLEEEEEVDEEAQQAAAEAEEEFLQSAEVTEDVMLMETRAKLEYVLSVLAMIGSVEAAVPKIAGMLQSKTTGDVVEALRFFTRAINFKVAGALSLFKSAFSLVWHQDVSIKTEMLTAFSAVYLTDGAGEQAQALSPAEIAHNLLHLVRNCDASEMTSMEKIVGEMFSTGQVSARAIDCIWERVEQHSAAASSSESAVAVMPVGVGFTELGASLRILAMVAQAVPSAMSEERVALVVASGLSTDTLHRGDLSALKAAMQCLQTTTAFLKHCESASSRDKYLGSAMQQALLEATPMIATVLLGAFCSESETATREWFSVCEEAMHALFHLHPCPDQVVSLVLQQMYEGLSSTAAAGDGQTGVCGIARLMFVLGQTSLCSLVYTESLAATAKKHPLKDSTTEESNAKTAAKTTKKAGAGASASNSGKFQENEGAVDAMEEEMGAAAAADADHERVLNQIIEQELVLRNLLGKFLPLLSYMVANEQARFSHTLLRETSILAMCRYMCTSATVCESLLPLLFTVLERETAVSVRTTVMIALGDLAFRFPNSIEPWTHRMYSRLRDADVTVRYNTLMVITHLVLNDMIKVKGQVSHVAMSLNDPHEGIAELAKLFFIKLSERSNNPVYNLLGDIIGIFSQDNTTASAAAVQEESEIAATTTSAVATETNVAVSLSKEQFQSTMHFLLSFVQKDKQADTLLERLLLRMSLSPSVLQRRNLAFCISELSVTEKGVKKMIELIKNIKDALYDHEVYECFRTTLARAKKVVRSGGAASETKSAIEEFEALMERIHSAANGEVGEGGALDLGDMAEALEELQDEAAGGTKPAAGRGASSAKTATSKKASTSKAKSKTAVKKASSHRADAGSDEDSDGDDRSSAGESDRDSDAENRTQNRAVKPSKAKTVAGKGAATGRSAPGRRVVRQDSEDSCEED